MAAACDSGDTCPRVFETEHGTVVVQGYVVREADVPALAAPPAGEAVVELPRDQFLEFARTIGERPAPVEGALLHGFRHTVFRLETLQQYSVEAEAERFRAWLDRQPLPERSVQTSPWLRRMAETTESGVKWSRVHLVKKPLTDYLGYEFVSYRESALAGQDTRIVDLDVHPDLAMLHEDFWLIDGDEPTALAVLMRYDPEGRFLGAWRTDDPSVLQECRRQRDMVLAASAPLEEYLASIDDPRAIIR
jgi:Family of unknown function (DUF6879)